MVTTLYFLLIKYGVSVHSVQLGSSDNNKYVEEISDK